jgi:hypothetical protein
MARRAFVAMGACLLVGLAVFAVPWFAKDRVLAASVPSPSALFSVAYVGVAPGQSACFADAAIEQHSELAQFRVATGGAPGPALELGLRGGGWSQTARVAGGYADGATVQAALRPPSRPVLARVCIANRGARPIRLFASADRTRSRSIATVAGRPQGASIWFALYERRPVSLAARLPVVFERVAAFRPGVVAPWTLWVLLVAVVLGVPLAVVLGFRAAVRDDDEPAGDRPATEPQARVSDPAPAAGRTPA